MKRTSNTNVRFLLIWPFPIVSVAIWMTVFAHLFSMLFESISIDYKTLELNYFVFETFYVLPFFASVSRPQELFDLRNAKC